MSLFAIVLFVATMALSLWATLRVRRVYGKFSQLPASSGLTAAGRIRRICPSAAGAQADRSNTDGRRKDGDRKSVARSGMDLRCRLHHLAWRLCFAPFTSNRRTQRVTNV
jgi:hypothetical protein